MSHKNLTLLADTAVLAGELMLTSGAETFRAETTMIHILRKGTNAGVTALALTTSIMITIEEPDTPPLTIIRRIHGSSLNLSRISMVNEISRSFCSDRISLEEAYEQLQNLPSSIYSRKWYALSIIGVAVGFTLFFGGTFLDVIATLITASVLACIFLTCKRLSLGGFAVNCMSSIGLALTCMFLKHTIFPAIDSDIVIIGSIMPLVPGVAITNAIRDTLQGDYISGSARILEAFVAAAAIAIGVGLGMLPYHFM